MDLLLGILGVALLLSGILDILWTTLWVEGGAGPSPSRLTTWAWKSVRRFGRHDTLFSLFGPAVLTLTIAIWVILLWAGWALLFAVDDTAVLSSSTRMPVGWVDRIYFAGYLVFTLGNGDFMPNGRIWQIATVLASGTGLLLLTLIITYVGSVISAVVDKRSFANQVTGFGMSAEDFLRSGWNGGDFHTFDLPLSTLSTQLIQITEQHFAYPILHYYRGAQPSKSPAIALAVLDDALTILRFGVPPDVQPNTATLSSGRAAVQGFLDTLHSAFMKPSESPPPTPTLAALRQADIPTVTDEQFEAAIRQLEERRRSLLGLVRDAGWDWPQYHA